LKDAANLLLIIALSYLAGSVPTSIIVGRLFFGKDPREFGSGNAGGTNAFRVFGWKAGVPTILVDVGKGILATLVISRLPAPEALPHEVVQIIAGSFAVIGHIWTVFAGFRGGKGVGTAAGMVISLYPLGILVCGGIFGLVLILGGIVSLASLAAAFAFPFVLLIMNALGAAGASPILLYFSLPLVLLIFFTHRANIKRLLSGTENRFEKLRIFRRR
jgi:glycerol-3-phosphate acyltransferase PlsY